MKSKTKVDVLLFVIKYNLRKYIYKEVQKYEDIKFYKLVVN